MHRKSQNVKSDRYLLKIFPPVLAGCRGTGRSIESTTTDRGGEKILFSTVSLNNCISVVVCWGSIDNTVSADFPLTIPRYSRAAKTLPSEKVKLFHHCKKCKAYKGIYYFQKVACLCVIADNRRPAWQVKTTIFRECRSKDQRKSGDAN